MRRVVAAVAVLVMAAPLAAGIPDLLERQRSDPRALAREWIEANVSPGSFIVMEAYGPQLLGSHTDWFLDEEVRQVARESQQSRRFYAVQNIPMYQVESERSGVFYDHNVLSMADVVVTTDAVRGRYGADPRRFAAQVAFYKELDRRYNRVQEFGRKDEGPAAITIYRNPSHRVPFAARDSVSAPPPLQEGLPAAPGAQERFYFNFGVNYESVRHYGAAYTCYQYAFRYSLSQPVMMADVGIGMARCLAATGQGGRAVELLSRLEGAAGTAGEMRKLRRFRNRLTAPR